MKLRILSTARLSFPLATALAAMLATPAVHAVNLYWDGNGTGTSGAGTTPSGTWGADVFWTTDSTGADIGLPVLTATTTTLDDVFFSAGTDATGAYAIGLNAAAQSARLVTFEEGTATLSIGTLALAAGGGITVLTASGDPIISSDISIAGGQTLNVETGRTLTLNTGTFSRGTRASLNIQGAGTVDFTMGGITPVNDIVGPWASFGTGASTKYANSTGNILTGLTGTPAATAADVTDTLGTFNYDVAAAGTLGTSASVYTLRYTGAAGTIATATAFTTKGIMNAGTGLLTFSGAVTSGAPANELVIDTANNGITFNGVLTGTVVKTGSGTMTLGAAAQTAGNLPNMTVNAGVLVTNTSTSDGLGGATVNSGGTLRWGSGNRHGNGAIFTLNAGGTLDLNGQGDLVGGLSGAGSVITTGTPTFAVGSAGTLTFSGVISGGLNLVKRNGGEQILSGANTFTGTTSVLNASATLTFGNTLAIQNSALATASSILGTTTTGLKTTVTSLTFGGLTGDKALASVFRTDSTGGPGGTTALGGYSGVTALTLNPGLGVTRSYSAVIADGAAGMTLIKTGGGTQTLTGPNTYAGPTLVSFGKLVVSSTQVGTGAATVSANATLGVAASGGSQWQPASLTLADPCSLEFSGLQNPGTTTAPLLPTAPVGTVSGVTVNITSLSGVVAVGNSYPLLGNQGGTTTGYTLGTQPTGVTGSLAVNGTTLVYVVSSVADIWTGANVTNPTFWDIATTVNWTGNALINTPAGSFVNGDDVLFDDTAAPASPVTVALQSAVAPGNMIFSNSSKAYTVNGAFGIGGSGTLTKIGSNTLTLSTDNSYTGATTVNAGNLAVTTNNALGTTAGATTINGGNGTGANTLNLSSATADLTIAEAINFFGNAVGRAQLFSDSAFNHTLSGNLNVTSVTNNVQFSSNGTGSITLSGDITGDVTGLSLLLRGTGLSATNRLTGNVNLTGGPLAKSDTGTWTIGAVGKTITLSGGLQAGIGILKLGAADVVADTTVLYMGNTTGGSTGTFDLNGYNETIGGIIQNGSSGAKLITNTGAAAVLTVDTGATNYSTGTLVSLTGSLGLTKDGSGILTLAANNTYSGSTTVIEGQLTISSANTGNDASTVTIAASGATLDLTYAGTDVVNSLVIGVTPQAPGVYGSDAIVVPGVIGIPQITGSGTLTVGAGFSSWITNTFTNGTVPLGQRGPNDDPDNDGISNLVEFAIALQDPTVGNTTIGTFDGTTLSFAKRQPLAASLTYVIQESIDLGSPTAWTPVTGGVNSTTTISCALTPGTPAKNFLRLQVLSN